MALFIIIML